MKHTRKLNYRINNIHKTTLRRLYKDYISSFDDLLVKDNSFRIHHTNLQKLAVEIFKVKINVPEVMKDIFRIVTNPYSLRNETKFKYCKVLTVRYRIETTSFVGHNNLFLDQWLPSSYFLGLMIETFFHPVENPGLNYFWFFRGRPNSLALTFVNGCNKHFMNHTEKNQNIL